MTHDLGLAAWFGGACMGAVGLNGATIEIDDHTQRTRVANAGWFAWAPVAATATISHIASAAALGRYGTSRDGGLGWWRPLETALTAAAVVCTAGSGIAGRRVAQAGDVPAATAVTPVDATPAEVARLQRLLRVAQWSVPLFTGALLVVHVLNRHQDSNWSR